MGSCFSKSDNTSKGSVLSKGSAVVPYSSPQNKRATMRLFGTELCPYTLRIRIALEYKGIPVQVLWLNADDENGRSKQLLAYMLPDGKLPLLQSEDHTISGSSDEIIDYIEGKFPNPSLSYKGSREWVELIRDKFSPLILKALYNADMLSQQETANQLDALFAKLDAAIGKHGSKGPYFFGNQFSLVDVYLVPFLLLERPLSFFQGISIDPAYTHLRGYSMRMTSFASYAPIRMDLDLLHESVSKNLEQSGPPPLVAMTLLQHHSILQHLEKLVVTTEELIAVSKQPCRAVDPVKGSLPRPSFNACLNGNCSRTRSAIYCEGNSRSDCYGFLSLLVLIYELSSSSHLGTQRALLAIYTLFVFFVFCQEASVTGIHSIYPVKIPSFRSC